MHTRMVEGMAAATAACREGDTAVATENSTDVKLLFTGPEVCGLSAAKPVDAL
jgi:hypothetical protein